MLSLITWQLSDSFHLFPFIRPLNIELRQLTGKYIAKVVSHAIIDQYLVVIL